MRSPTSPICVKVYEALIAQLKSQRPPGLARRGDGGPHLARDLSGRPRKRLAAAWGRLRKPREVAVLMEVAAWREREAQSRDVPRGRVLKDDALIDIATSAPRTVEALGRLRSIPNGFERSRTATDILEAVERGLLRDPKTVPVPERLARRGGNGRRGRTPQGAPQGHGRAGGVAPKIIATVEDLEAIADDDGADVPSSTAGVGSSSARRRSR